jgi:hypothetical protein
VADDSERPRFGRGFDKTLPIGAEGNHAYFGLDVLRGLVDGIDDFVRHRQSRWDQFRGDGTTMLACAMYMDDPVLIEKIAQMESACIVISKQPRKRSDLKPPPEPRKLRALAELNERTCGLPVEFFPQLEGLTSLVDGKPPVIGPGWSSPDEDASISTIRTLGFRKDRGNHGPMPPILHAKLALLGRLWTHDEDDYGFADVTQFTAKRLWVSSANFTASSRRSLEFGYWTEEPELLSGAEDFLLNLIANSEGLDPEEDSFIPDRTLPDYDEDAMWEWERERRLDWEAEQADPESEGQVG